MTTIKAIWAIAAEKIGRPDATGIVWERLDMKHDGIDAYKVTLADVPVYKGGPKLGKPNYRNCTNRQTTYLTDDEVDAWFVAHPGVCRRCHNEREVMVSASTDGVVMKPCPVCGIAKEPEAQGTLL